MFFASTVVAAIAGVVLAAHGAQALDADCARNYTVLLGDTCDIIAAKEGVSTYQILTVNADKVDAACDNLALGEPLCLGISGQDCTTVHVVEEGDSCATIAESAGTGLDTLFANNPNVNVDCSNIYPGEVLCTAESVIVTNSTSTSA